MVDQVLESFKNKIKKMYEKRDTLFQPTQSTSALKKFAIQYGIQGLNEYDPESFLLNLEVSRNDYFAYYKPYDQHTTN